MQLHVDVCLSRKSAGCVMALEQVMIRTALTVMAMAEKGTVRVTTSNPSHPDCF